MYWQDSSFALVDGGHQQVFDFSQLLGHSGVFVEVDLLLSVEFVHDDLDLLFQLAHLLDLLLFHLDVSLHYLSIFLRSTRIYFFPSFRVL